MTAALHPRHQAQRRRPRPPGRPRRAARALIPRSVVAAWPAGWQTATPEGCSGRPWSAAWPIDRRAAGRRAAQVGPRGQARHQLDLPRPASEAARLARLRPPRRPSRAAPGQISAFVDFPWPPTPAATASRPPLLHLTMPGVPDLYQGSERTVHPGRPRQPPPVAFDTCRGFALRVLDHEKERHLDQPHRPAPAPPAGPLTASRSRPPTPDRLLLRGERAVIVATRLSVGLARRAPGRSTRSPFRTATGLPD